MADTPTERRWYERYGDDGSMDTYGQEGSARATYEGLRDAAKFAGSAAKAFGEGAYSVLPGTYNFGRGLLRGSGLLGSEELRRFDQEMDVTAAALEQIARHPEPAVRAAGKAASSLLDPVVPFHVVGRMLAGHLSALGPLATIGDTLRAIEDGHNLVDAFLYPGLQGRQPPGGLLGVPPEGRGLLGIPPGDSR